MTISLETISKLFDHSDVGVAVMHREEPGDIESLRNVYCNEACAAALGMSLDYLVGRRAVDVSPNVRASGVLDIYAQTLASGESFQMGEQAYSDENIDEAVFRSTFVPVGPDTLVVQFVNVTEQRRAQEQLERQNQLILALSTPIIELWKGILLLPLIGELDASRIQQMIEHLLDAIASHGARVAIFDITGVASIDTTIAQNLMQAVQAARMLGADAIVTGIRPEFAITMAKLGLDISDIRTFRSLHSGVASAFRALKLDIVDAAAP